MADTSLSFADVISHKALRLAQAPLRKIAEQLRIPEVSGQYDFRPVLSARREAIATDTATVRLGKDGIVIAVSPVICRDHFDPYQMAVFASSEIQAAGLRAELQTWIDYAIDDLLIPRERLFTNTQTLVNWYTSLHGSDKKRADRLEMLARISGLVTRYCHPHAHADIRSDILERLQALAESGVNDAAKVFQLLISPSVDIISNNESRRHREFVDSPVTSLWFELVEDSYELEIKRLIYQEPTTADAHRSINRLVRERRLKNRTVDVVFAGVLEEIDAVYSIYLIFKQLIATFDITNVRIDIGVVDTVFYIANRARYATVLNRWFQNEQTNIPGLAHLIRSAASNDFDSFQIRQSFLAIAPTAEELVLFFLRMMSPMWHDAFVNIIRERSTRILHRYLSMKEQVQRFIPADWRYALNQYGDFSKCVHCEAPTYNQAAYLLQPINLMTDNQITQATVIVTASQRSLTRLAHRFPGGVLEKAVFLGEGVSDTPAHSRGAVTSPYIPRKFLSKARWDPIKEKSIRSLLSKHIIPILKQEVSTQSVKATRLFEQKKASRAAIESVKRYIIKLQELSMQGNDQSLIDGFIFVLAVLSDIEPDSDQWRWLVDRYRQSREELQNEVFAGTVRTLSDLMATRFLRHYVGPKGYIDRHFPHPFQRYNEELVELIARNLSIGAVRDLP